MPSVTRLDVADDPGYPYRTLDLPLSLHLSDDMGPALLDLSLLCSGVYPHLPPSSIHLVGAKPRVGVRERMGRGHVYHLPGPLVMG